MCEFEWFKQNCENSKVFFLWFCDCLPLNNVGKSHTPSNFLATKSQSDTQYTLFRREKNVGADIPSEWWWLLLLFIFLWVRSYCCCLFRIELSEFGNIFAPMFNSSHSISTWFIYISTNTIEPKEKREIKNPLH